jgi:xanthine dehydrogenase YagT iron-sulfur-binding subunit
MDHPDPSDPHPHDAAGSSRREFLRRAGGLFGAVLAAPHLVAAAEAPTPAENATPAATPAATATDSTGAAVIDLELRVNGQARKLRAEPCVTLLDALRDRLDLTGTKKGCDHGTCGACTVHVDGQRVLSCLTLAVMAQGREITTIEGLAKGEELHPVQAAFVECDGFQCGFCTPGQIMSSVACIKEGHTKSDAEIREWMSGNICRCAAYPNILDAIKKAAAAPTV